MSCITSSVGAPGPGVRSLEAFSGSAGSPDVLALAISPSLTSWYSLSTALLSPSFISFFKFFELSRCILALERHALASVVLFRYLTGGASWGGLSKVFFCTSYVPVLARCVAILEDVLGFGLGEVGSTVFLGVVGTGTGTFAGGVMTL